MGRQLKLNLFIYPGGHHEPAWRHPKSQTDRLLDIGFYQELAQRAEAAKLDAVFYADGPALESNVQYATRFRIEPFTWLSAVAVATERIGLIGTASTTYLEPYNAARLFASLDHLSKGRAGWNIVTTGAERAAQNFGLDEHPPHAERYSRADEFVRVVGKLWDSWEDGAVVADAGSGLFADPSLIHKIGHEGKYLRVAGPLNTPRSPQGRPVFVQAGSSADGKAFAAEHAEAVFTAHQSLASAQVFYSDIKEQAAAFGRDPGQLLVLPGISPYLGSTEAEARALNQEFDELTQPEYGLGILRKLLGIDLDGVPLDGQFPPDLLAAAGNAGSRSQLVLDIIRRKTSRSARCCTGSPAPAGIMYSPEPPCRWRTRSSAGSGAAPRTDSTSCRRGCPGALRRSLMRWFPSSRPADCSAPSTRAGLCGSTSASTGPTASMRRRQTGSGLRCIDFPDTAPCEYKRLHAGSP
ncbi:FMN-dependent oxidoreductase (nitrilotriacetate monooxygenase family) [Arthrobacter oryzae]|uniref:LLM class flavin-dependent oxidoreductase n=1 Tax=Arthrobacter oryzae TaxID=409290 RepID=UPI00278A1C41|nr:LLM class flavin-dependent oxidoreductase [Arthrobacter oryzae]MDP9985389.1 FMN-dependent oxidoreductase (nitrilotriacetate monooxygenase family) [Arthrobacter oryzae]